MNQQREWGWGFVSMSSSTVVGINEELGWWKNLGVLGFAYGDGVGEGFRPPASSAPSDDTTDLLHETGLAS